ncbi:MAG: efflux RND transporter periplasmic adaptor subunit [Steroidobacteraceae bacterium]
MSRRSVACLALGLLAAWSLPHADGAPVRPSVLVTLAQLKEGALPHQVIAYGTVGPSSASRKTIMAPVSAVVDTVYVRLGEAVSRGAPLVRLAPSPQTAAAYAQARSAMIVARHLLASTRKLVAEHLATAQQLADAEKSLADARSQLRAFQSLGASGSNVVRAPFAAIVTLLAASPGAIVTQGSPLLDLAALRGLVLTVGVVPVQAGEINAGDTARVTLIGAGRSVVGRVVLRGDMAVSGSGLVPVEIALPPGTFMPGEMGEAAITTREVRGYVVPHAAILVNSSGATYVVQAVGQVAHEVRVRILDSQGDRNVITGPLIARAPLVLTGNHQLSNGMRIRLAGPNAHGARR